MTKPTLTRRVVRAALVAAIYAALCVLLAPAATAPVQVRISEALTLLPVLFPEAVVGVTVGCFLSNLLLSVPLDVVVGTLTTLAAALLTRKFRGVRWKGLPILSSLPPILLNALFVGTALTYLYDPAFSVPVWILNMGSVGLGQLISCGVAGTLFIWVMEKNSAFQKISGV